MYKNQPISKTFVIIGFIIAGGLLRLLFTIKFPNVNPMWVVMLFGGAYLTDKRLAFIAPLGIMFFTDLTLEIIHQAGWREFSGFHKLMPFVYFGFLLSVVIGILFKNNIKPLPLLGAGVLATTVFFIISNFGVWAMGGYAPTAAGLIECYAAGLMYYGYSTISTLFFIPVFFGGFEFVKNSYFSPAPAQEFFKPQDSTDALRRKKVEL